MLFIYEMFLYWSYSCVYLGMSLWPQFHPTRGKQKWKLSHQIMISIPPQQHGCFWIWKSLIHCLCNKWKLFVHRYQLWVNDEQIILHQNTPINSISISSNKESTQMIRLHLINLFTKLLALLVAHSQYHFWSETWFHGKGFNFLQDLFHCCPFCFGLNCSVCWFWNKMEVY